MVGEVLQQPLITDRAWPPVIALITDGLPTDDYFAGLDYLLSKTWGRRAVRVVVAIGEDSRSEEAQTFFRTFIDNEAVTPFQVNSPEELVEAIRWVATAVLKSVASPLSRNADQADGEPSESTNLGVEALTPVEANLW